MTSGTLQIIQNYPLKLIFYVLVPPKEIKDNLKD